MGRRHQAQVHRESNKHSGCIGSEMRNSLFIAAKLRKKLVMAKEKAEKNQINGEGHFKLAKK